MVGDILPKNKISGHITLRAWQKGQLKCEVYKFGKTNAYTGSGRSWFYKYRKNWQTCHTSAAIEFLLPLQKWNHRAAPQGAQFAWLGDKTSPGQIAEGHQRRVRGGSLLSVRNAVSVLESSIPWCSWLRAKCQLAGWRDHARSTEWKRDASRATNSSSNTLTSFQTTKEVTVAVETHFIGKTQIRVAMRRNSGSKSVAQSILIGNFRSWTKKGTHLSRYVPASRSLHYCNFLGYAPTFITLKHIPDVMSLQGFDIRL